ncbi:MAG: hypothetical protein KatS3mg023_3702 [Armatimonadota bacterium]|jgi:hypothetical protein|nr:MAG: hypothetical protein KatS3mg023_3702 [Armatimonadota bacterium]
MMMLDRLLKGMFIKWLRERALVIPYAKRVEIAKRLKVDQEIVDSVLFELRDHILRELEK